MLVQASEIRPGDTLQEQKVRRNKVSYRHVEVKSVRRGGHTPIERKTGRADIPGRTVPVRVSSTPASLQAVAKVVINESLIYEPRTLVNVLRDEPSSTDGTSLSGNPAEAGTSKATAHAEALQKVANAS